MEQQTYEQAVEKTVNFWAEKSFKTSANQNNGDAMGSGLANMLAVKSREQLPEGTEEKFREELTKILLLEKDVDISRRGYCDVDYHPCHSLSEACKLSGTSVHILPIKTFTFIETDNSVQGRYQYGGDWFTL